MGFSPAHDSRLTIYGKLAADLRGYHESEKGLLILACVIRESVATPFSLGYADKYSTSA